MARKPKLVLEKTSLSRKLANLMLADGKPGVIGIVGFLEMTSLTAHEDHGVYAKIKIVDVQQLNCGKLTFIAQLVGGHGQFRLDGCQSILSAGDVKSQEAYRQFQRTRAAQFRDIFGADPPTNGYSYSFKDFSNRLSADTLKSRFRQYVTQHVKGKFKHPELAELMAASDMNPEDDKTWTKSKLLMLVTELVPIASPIPGKWKSEENDE